MNIEDSNIAIVHDWFLKKSFGGAEKVTFILNDFLKERYSAPDNFSLTSNIESSEKNILDFFSYKNLENASLIKIEIENENSIYYYNFNNNILLISFNNSQSMVKEISLFQAENSIFQCKIVDINKYQNPLKFLNIDDSWTTIDWR